MGLCKLVGMIVSPAKGAARLARGAFAERRGSMAPLFALTLPVILLVLAGATDFALAVSAKSDLQDAADAAALAVANEVEKNPNDTVATLQAIALSTLTANHPNPAPSVTDFHVCAPVQ